MKNFLKQAELFSLDFPPGKCRTEATSNDAGLAG
jgi:hypothetical protein